MSLKGLVRKLKDGETSLNILNEVIVSFKFSLITEGERGVASFRKKFLI